MMSKMLTLKKARLATLFSIALVSMLLVFGVTAQAAVNTVNISWYDVKQNIDGIGTGQAGWAPSLYSFPEPARSNIMNLAFDPINGIGMSILRMEIGAGGLVANPNVPNYPIGGESMPTIEPFENVWDFAYDRDQIWVMQKARDLGVSKIMATAWSPPAWMKSNQDAKNGGVLLANKYQAFADYLSRYVREYKIRHNIDIYAISPANEPLLPQTWQSAVWTGANFQNFLANYLKPTFTADGVTAKVVLGELAHWGESVLTETLNDPTARSRMDIAAAHLYGGSNPSAVLTNSVQYDKPVWMTEASLLSNGKYIDSALVYARTIHKSLADASTSAWIFWTLGIIPDFADQGLITLDDSVAGTYTVRKTFWALGNYSKFIKPGYVRMGSDTNITTGLYTSAYKDPITNKFAIVAVNESTSAKEVNFGQLGFSGGNVIPYITSASQSLAQLAAVSMSGTVTIPAKSIVTYVGTATPGTAANVAPSAMVTQSSQFSAAYSGSKAVDGTIGQHTVGEWASLGELTPWIQLTWGSSQTINNIKLYDRPNLTDGINAGTLTFSDGSSIAVGTLNNAGAVRDITFPSKTVTWVKFQVTSGTGTNVGLSEIQAYSPPPPNVAPSATVTQSSQYSAAYSGSKAVDGTIGQHAIGEWASLGQLTPWIQLTWGTSQTINNIKLYDRPNLSDGISAGTLTFSDGSSITVGALDNAGAVKDITFPNKTVTWVRFQVTTGTGTNVGLAEMQAYSLPGTNIALNKAVTVSSIYGTGYEASKAVDGNTATRWSSAYSDPQWISIDLGSPYNVSGVKLRWDPAYASSYQIQVSNDAVAWTDVYSTTVGVGGIVNINFSATSARYVRMYGTVRATIYGYSLSEFEVYQ